MDLAVKQSELEAVSNGSKNVGAKLLLFLNFIKAFLRAQS